MNKLAILIISLLEISYAIAVEKIPNKNIDTNDLTSELQVTPKEMGDDHFAIIWWIPNEFWEASLIQNAAISDTDRKAMMNALTDITLLVVAQADITDLGAFQFYSKEEIQSNMFVSYISNEGREQRLSGIKTLSSDLEVIIGVFKPILGAAMGNFGNNMHFYVFNDKSKTSLRLLDPYQKGKIIFKLTKRNNDLLTAQIEMPLNSLHIPRNCPNGKDAHISWLYCPWSGKKLKD